MNELKLTPQLNTEIDKLKEKDYTSYQIFYGQTSGYLYGKIYDKVQNQSVANEIMNDLYTNIYESIGTELTDNSQFYTWALDKADTLTNTYLTTHGVTGAKASSEKERNAEGAAVVVAANAGMNTIGGASEGVSIAGTGAPGMGQATGGAGQVGMSQTTGGAGQVGMSQATGGAGQVGMSQASGGAGHAGMGQTTGGAGHAGMGQYANGKAQAASSHAENPQTANAQHANNQASNDMARTTNGTGSGTAQAAGESGNTVGGAGNAVAKTGTGIGIKIAIGIAAVAVIGTAAFFALKDKDKEDKNEPTTEMVSSNTEDMDTEATTEPITEEVTEATTEATTEELVEDDFNTEGFEAYYDVLQSCLATNPLEVQYSGGSESYLTGFSYAQLIDINGTGNPQLIIGVFDNEMYVRKICVYDYIDGEAVLIGELDADTVYYLDVDGKTGIMTQSNHYFDEYAQNGVLYESYDYTLYMYEDGGLKSTKKYTVETLAQAEMVTQCRVDDSDIPDASALAEIENIKDTAEGYSLLGAGRGLSTKKEDATAAIYMKHKTINRIAEYMEDDEFINSLQNAYAEYSEENNSWYSYVVTNGYNEKYSIFGTIDCYGTATVPELSADKKVIHAYDWSNGSAYFEGDSIFVYENDMLMLAGYMKEGYENDQQYEKYFWYNLSSKDIEYNEISKSEYQSKVDEKLK